MENGAGFGNCWRDIGVGSLIRVGAYQKGTDVVLDGALQILRTLNLFLRQRKEEKSTFDQARAQLLALPG